jgi:Rrf2 family protein
MVDGTISPSLSSPQKRLPLLSLRSSSPRDLTAQFSVDRRYFGVSRAALVHDSPQNNRFWRGGIFWFGPKRPVIGRNPPNPIGKPGYASAYTEYGTALRIQTTVELPCKSEYALLALIELAAAYGQGEPLQIRQISALHNIPDRYLEQLLATLRRAGFLRSQRGAKGGYLLAREPKKITLLEIVNCIEGFEVCGEDESLPAKPLENGVILEIWQAARQAHDAVLQQYTLQDLAERRDARRQLDIMYYI